MEAGNHHRIRTLSVILISFTLFAMTAVGGIGVKLLFDAVWSKPPFTQDMTDEEAMRLCIFSHRSLKTCTRMVQERHSAGAAAAPAKSETPNINRGMRE